MVRSWEPLGASVSVRGATWSGPGRCLTPLRRVLGAVLKWSGGLLDRSSGYIAATHHLETYLGPLLKLTKKWSPERFHNQTQKSIWGILGTVVFPQQTKEKYDFLLVVLGFA